MGRLGVRDGATGFGSDQSAFPSGFEGGQTADDRMKKVGHAAQCVVIEGRHLTGVDAAIGKHGIPALPDRGSAHTDRI